MPEPLSWKSKVILADIEAAYGTDPVPTQAILAKNVSVKPMDGEDVTRDIERPFFGAQPSIPTGLRTVIEFDCELVGSGTAGTPPAFGPLLRACALSETISAGVSATYAPVHSALESAALYFWIGGTQQKILGARGSVSLNLTAQQIPTLHFTLTGLWAAPTAVATPAIDLSDFPQPQIVNSVNTNLFTVNGVALVLRSFALDRQNDVQPRLLVARDEIMIVDSNEAMSMQVEAVPIATFDLFGLVNARTTMSVVLHHGPAGSQVNIQALRCQIMRPDGYQNQNSVLEWALKLVPLPSDAGDDQFSLVFK